VEVFDPASTRVTISNNMMNARNYQVEATLATLNIVMKLCTVRDFLKIFNLYCDRFDATSDMNAATQRPGTDSGVSYATVFRIYGTEI
jgi:hypothetical protein